LLYARKRFGQERQKIATAAHHKLRVAIGQTKRFFLEELGLKILRARHGEIPETWGEI
jgi:hypothetical protein